MHDIRFIREHPDVFDRALARRNLTQDERKLFSSQNLLSIDERRRAIKRVYERAQSRRKAIPIEIADAKNKNDQLTFKKLMEEVCELRDTISRTDLEEKSVGEELSAILLQIPNLPLDDVPDGIDAAENVERHRFGTKRDFAFTPRQHFDLGEALGQMDFETAAKLSGARFVILKKGLARLERALGQFMLDVHTTEHGYTEVAPPLLVRDDVMFGTAQLPKFELDQFLSTTIDKVADAETNVFLSTLEGEKDDKGEKDDTLLAKLELSLRASRFSDLTIKGQMERARQKLANKTTNKNDSIIELKEPRRWLIPTAEVPLTNLVRESILDEARLPIRLTACTPCFRAEAGAAGKDTRGMIRQHQFSKVELVSITTPEQSKDEHERMLSCAEEILRRLDLHYRVMTLSTGDMGFASQKTYDIEVWLPGQNMFREISSCSVCGEFQARRMNARYRSKEDRAIRHVHTLNGSGVAVGRALIAIMETYQQEDGSIAVPEVLQPYMGGLKKIERQ